MLFGRKKSAGFSFEASKKQNEVRDFLSRLLNVTSPNVLLLGDDESRMTNRHNRTVPIYVIPLNGVTPDCAAAHTALTKDISDRGLSIVTREQPLSSELILAFWLPDERGSCEGRSRYVLGHCRQTMPLGAGYWQIGVEVLEVLTSGCSEYLDRFEPQLQNLAPRELAAEVS